MADQERVTFLTADGREVDAWGRPADKPIVPPEPKPPVTEPDPSQVETPAAPPAEEPGAEETAAPNYEEMTVEELKEELKQRQEAGREFDTSQIKKKSDLVSALEADDEAQQA